MSATSRLTTLERWLVAPPPPDEPDADGAHWWREDPRFKRLVDALHSLLAYVRQLERDPDMAAFLRVLRLPAGTLTKSDPDFLAATAAERRIPGYLLLWVCEPLAELSWEGNAGKTVLEELPITRALEALLRWTMPREDRDADLHMFMRLVRLPAYSFSDSNDAELLSALRGEAKIPEQLLAELRSAIREDGSFSLPTWRAVKAAENAENLLRSRLKGDSAAYWRSTLPAGHPLLENLSSHTQKEAGKA